MNLESRCCVVRDSDDDNIVVHCCGPPVREEWIERKNALSSPHYPPRGSSSSSAEGKGEDWQLLGEQLPRCHIVLFRRGHRCIEFQIKSPAPAMHRKPGEAPLEIGRGSESDRDQALRRILDEGALRSCMAAVGRCLLDSECSAARRTRLVLFFAKYDEWSFEAQADINPRTSLHFHLRHWEICDNAVGAGVGNSGVLCRISTTIDRFEETWRFGVGGRPTTVQVDLESHRPCPSTRAVTTLVRHVPPEVEGLSGGCSYPALAPPRIGGEHEPECGPCFISELL